MTCDHENTEVASTTTTSIETLLCADYIATFLSVHRSSSQLVDKLKVRIAIRGDLDTGAKDEDNAAPLATFRLLKLFICEAARSKRRIYQADFIGAYLQANMDRAVYVMLPMELKDFFPDLAEWFSVPVPLLLEKSCYGINSAGR